MTYTLSDPEVYRDLVLSLIGRPQAHDTILCASESARQALQNMVGRLSGALAIPVSVRLPIVPLGIDTRRFAPQHKRAARKAVGIPAEVIVFLCLGRLSPCDKADLYPLLRAFRTVRLARPSVLILAGGTRSPDVLVPLRAWSAQLGLSDAVRFEVNVSPERRLTLLAAADVFVSPADSVQESFGLALVEAMASGLPVVASDWNGYREIVEHLRTGLLVPTLMADAVTGISQTAVLDDRDMTHWELGQAVAVDTTALAQAMVRLAGDADLRARMGRAGQRRSVELYDWRAVVGRVEEEWARSLETPSAQAVSGSSAYWYDYSEVFNHYPTAWLTSSSVVQTARNGFAPPCMPPRPPFISRQMLDELLDRLAEPTALDSIPGDQASVLRHVAYLIKHGFAEEVGQNAHLPHSRANVGNRLPLPEAGGAA